MTRLPIEIFFNGEIISVRAWPDRPFRAVKVWRDDDRACFAINAKGHLFSTLAGGKRHFYGGRHGLNGTAIAILSGIAQLGALPREGVAKLKAEHEKRQAARDRGWAAKQILDEAKDAGLKLTPAQTRQLTRAKRAA